MEEKYIDLKTDFGFKRISAEIATYSSEERKEYEQSRRAYQDIKIGMDSAQKVGEEKGLKKGLEQGRKEGLKKGREEGLKQGREQGMAEGMKKENMQWPGQ